MCYCSDLIAYLDDDTDELPYPCEHCAHWIEKTDACTLETEKRLQRAYEEIKVINPVKTTAKPGYDIPALIKSEFSNLYKSDCLLQSLDLNDLDGVLDYLYGAYQIFKNSEHKRLIDFIEARCEIKK